MKKRQSDFSYFYLKIATILSVNSSVFLFIIDRPLIYLDEERIYFWVETLAISSPRQEIRKINHRSSILCAQHKLCYHIEGRLFSPFIFY